MKTLKEIAPNQKIILFDGVCNLCNSSIQFIIKYDKNDSFKFASIQSNLGQEIIKHIKISAQIDSIILFETPNTYYYKSKAVTQIAKTLGGYFKIVLIYNLLPIKTQDSIYDIIAKNRYKWFGKKENCLLPSKKTKDKFFS